MKYPFDDLLKKGNPKATRRSVFIAAAVGAILGPIAFYFLSMGQPQFRGPSLWLIGAVVGAVSFAAIEWQQP